MKVFSVLGMSSSEKSATIEHIIRELRRRNYSVGLVKESYLGAVELDESQNNRVGNNKDSAQIVTTRGFYKTDISFQRKLSIDEILLSYDHDYVILDGVTDCNVPRMITACTKEGVMDLWDERTFVISGIIANSQSEFNGLPIISAIHNTSELVDLIKEKVFEQLPNFPQKCCNACGISCQSLCAAILKGNAKRSDCVLGKSTVQLKVNEREILMVPFVQKMLKNAIRGVVSELDGYRVNGQIEIRIGEKFNNL